MRDREIETGQTEPEDELLDRLALDKHRHELESLIATYRIDYLV